MTTLNLQVSANADDGWSSTDTNFYPNHSYINVGIETDRDERTGWWRFTGVSGLSGATIITSSAQVNSYDWGQLGSPLTKVYAEDAAAPTAPANQADHAGRVRTTAGVDWDGVLSGTGWDESPSLNSVIQELADTYDPSVIQLLHDDDGGPAGNNYQGYGTHDLDSANAPKLDIDYTAGGVTTRRYGLTVLGVG